MLFIPLIAVLLAIVGVTRSMPQLMDVRYLLDSSTLYVETGLLALGMTLVIISGNIDLSVGSNLVLTACLVAKLFERGWSISLVLVAACLLGTSFGALNGIMVAKFRLPSFLVTLGTMALYRGAAQAALGPASIKLPGGFKGIDQARLFGLPWPVLIFFALAIGFAYLLHRTFLGRWIFSVGSNERASVYSGVPTDRVKISVFAITGLMAGIGALLLDSRLGVARYDVARGIELDSITIAVLGGTAIQGGKGTVLGTVSALALVAFAKTAMGVANVKAEYQLTAMGLLLVLAVLLTNLAGKFSARAIA